MRHKIFSFLIIKQIDGILKGKKMFFYGKKTCLGSGAKQVSILKAKLILL